MHHIQRLFQLLPGGGGRGLCFACDNVLISGTRHKFSSCIVICQSRNMGLGKKKKKKREGAGEETGLKRETEGPPFGLALLQLGFV